MNANIRFLSLDEPSVTIPQSSYSVEFGNTVTIPCAVSANPQVTSITWQRTSGGITQTLVIGNVARYSGGTVTTPSLTITNAQLEDEGNYRCIASNGMGTGQSGLALVNVVGSMLK
jgi:hypothetical protein